MNALEKCGYCGQEQSVNGRKNTFCCRSCFHNHYKDSEGKWQVIRWKKEQMKADKDLTQIEDDDARENLERQLLDALKAQAYILQRVARKEGIISLPDAKFKAKRIAMAAVALMTGKYADELDAWKRAEMTIIQCEEEERELYNRKIAFTESTEGHEVLLGERMKAYISKMKNMPYDEALRNGVRNISPQGLPPAYVPPPHPKMVGFIEVKKYGKQAKKSEAGGTPVQGQDCQAEKLPEMETGKDLQPERKNVDSMETGPGLDSGVRPHGPDEVPQSDHRDSSGFGAGSEGATGSDGVQGGGVQDPGAKVVQGKKRRKQAGKVEVQGGVDVADLPEWEE